MTDEQALIAALRRRDKNALAEIFDRYSDRIYRLALSVLSDEQAADGVVQDTFMTLIERIDTFEGRSRLGTWLYRVAYNNALSRLRSLKPQLDLDGFDEDDVPIPANLVDWQTTPEELLGSAEAMAEVSRAVETLNPALRAVFLLRDVEELSTQETADALGISPGAVKVRLHRARLALREALAGYFSERLGM